MQTVFTLVAASALIVSIAVGYRWLAWPYAAPLRWPGRVLLGLPVATLAVALGVPFWWAAAKESFPWLLPPLASRMLAAAGLSFVVLSWLVLRHPSRPRVRLLLVMVAVYLVPLLVALWAFHRDRIDVGQMIGWGFLVLADGLGALVLVFLWRQPTVIEPGPRDREPASAAVRAFLGGVALVSGLWGLALFVTDEGPIAAVWVWPGDVLSSRLIGVMLAALAAGCVFSMARADVARVMLWTVLTYGFGLVAASLWQVVVAKPITPAYLSVFGVVGAGAAALLLTTTPTARAGPPLAPT